MSVAELIAKLEEFKTEYGECEVMLRTECDLSIEQWDVTKTSLDVWHEGRGTPQVNVVVIE